MKRRAFLTSAASALPFALADPFASALRPETTAPPKPHFVPAHEDRFGESHAPFLAEMLFKTSTAETPTIFAIEHTAIQPGWGPHLHMHLYQEEWFYVMEGQVLIQVGSQRITAGPGDSILGPRNVPHAFLAVGAKPARMLIVFTPGGKMEQFFREGSAAGPEKNPHDSLYYGVKVLGPPLSQS